MLQHYDYKYGVFDPNSNSLDETKNNGQIARIEGTIGTQKQWQQNFTYDSIGRLSSAREFRGDNPDPSGQSYLINYDYDLFGNRKQKQANNSSNPFAQIWTEDADIDQTTNRIANSVTYDNAGNVLTDQKYRQLKFQYDANNRQKQSSNLDDTGAVASVYDAAGQRVATQIAGALTNVLVYDAMGKLVAEYGSSSTANGTQYLMGDHQGSTRAVMKGSGIVGELVVSRHDYLPFGEELYAGVGMRATNQSYNAADSVRQKYAGMETDDATGMAHTLWRNFDSVSGRWTAPDPYGGSMSIASPQSFNRYTYVNNDPMNFADPLGLEPYTGADKGWSDLEGGFWPTGFDFNASHFGGPGEIQTAAARHELAVNSDMNGGEYNDPNPYDDFFWKEGKGVGYRDENGVLRNPDGTLYRLPAENVNVGIIGPPSVNKPPSDPDFGSISFSVPVISILNVQVSLTRDKKYGNWFFGIGPGMGRSLFPLVPTIQTGEAFTGDGSRVGREDQVVGVLGGYSFGGTVTDAGLVGGRGVVSGSYNTGVIGFLSFPFSNGGGRTVATGFGPPQIGLAKQMSFHIYSRNRK